jgi:hypothetical protein
MILPNVKPTFATKNNRKYVLENIHNLVVKQTDFWWLRNAYWSKIRATGIYCKIKTTLEIISHID